MGSLPRVLTDFFQVWKRLRAERKAVGNLGYAELCSKDLMETGYTKLQEHPMVLSAKSMSGFCFAHYWQAPKSSNLFQTSGIDLSSAQYFFRQMFHPCRWCWVDCQSSGFDQWCRRFAAVQRFFWRTWELLHLIVQVSWMIPLLGQFWSQCCCGLGTFDILWPRPRKQSEKRKRERGPWALRGAWYEMKNRVPLWRGCTQQRLGVRSVIRYSWQISSRIDSSKCELLLHGFAPK